MFASACALAKEFTFPIIISYRQHSNACNCGMGAFVVVNNEGWAITAAHIISELVKYESSIAEYDELMMKRKIIEDDNTLKNHIKSTKLGTLKVNPASITNYSVYLDGVGTHLGIIYTLPEVDLAIFKIEGFNEAKVASYPVFKDPTKPMLQGTTLCKLGFPFHDITPLFDTDAKIFRLPQGAVPAPYFPIEGIFTRKLKIPTTYTPRFPCSIIETSSPGLRGQSGGPTFDVSGNIWAIQSMTNSYKLGFGQNAQKSKEAEHMQNQYLNVGWGIHSETITNFLTSNGINFLTSPN